MVQLPAERIVAVTEPFDELRVKYWMKVPAVKAPMKRIEEIDVRSFEFDVMTPIQRGVWDVHESVDEHQAAVCNVGIDALPPPLRLGVVKVNTPSHREWNGAPNEIRGGNAPARLGAVSDRVPSPGRQPHRQARDQSTWYDARAEMPKRRCEEHQVPLEGLPIKIEAASPSEYPTFLQMKNPVCNRHCFNRCCVHTLMPRQPALLTGPL